MFESEDFTRYRATLWGSTRLGSLMRQDSGAEDKHWETAEEDVMKHRAEK